MRWRLAALVPVLVVAGCTGRAAPTARTPTTAPATTSTTSPGPALAHGRWARVRPGPLRARQDSALVWTGHLLLEYGGTAHDVPVFDAAAYDPARRAWHRMAPPPVAVGTADEARVWTGRRLFVSGGRTPPYHVLVLPACCAGGLYDPAANRWEVTARSPLPPLVQLMAVWTGRRVVVVGLTTGRQPALRAAAYDPSRDQWQRLDPPVTAGHPPIAVAAVATSDRVILWSLWGRVRHTGPGTTVGYSGVDVFALVGTHWTTVTGRWPQHHTVDRPIFTGSDILFAPGQIWCGECSHPAPTGEHGYRADPATLAITPIKAGPLDDLGPWTVWTGHAEIALNAGGEMSGPRLHVRPGDIAFWDPIRDAWSRGPRAPAAIEPMTPPVWGGDRLYALTDSGRLLTYVPR